MSASFERAFFFLLDGARVDVFRDLLGRGDLPNVARYLVERGSVGEATSVFPTVTGVAYIPFVTGRFPGPANVPGIRWFDRATYGRTKLSLSRFRSYTGLGSYLLDRDLHRDARTLFELLAPASNIFSGVSRGTGVRRNAAYFRRIPYGVYLMRTGHWEMVDQRGRDYLLTAAKRRDRFTFHTTFSVDEYSHQHGPFSEKVRSAYVAFDRVIGELICALRASGQLDRTLLLLSADHGHTDVVRHLDLEAFFERRRPRTFYYPFSAGRYFACDAACMVGGNSMAHVYLRGRRGWLDQSTGEELLAEEAALVDDLLAEEAVHLVAWRQDPTGATIALRTARGQAEVRLEGSDVAYHVLRGEDPFGYPALPARMTRPELLERTRTTDYPDAPLQVAQLFESPRSGDFVISAHRGFDLRARFERWDHRSCHGSLHREHIQVPLVSSHPLLPGPWRTADVFSTVLAGLGQPIPPSDGRNLLN